MDCADPQIAPNIIMIQIESLSITESGTLSLNVIDLAFFVKITMYVETVQKSQNFDKK